MSTGKVFVMALLGMVLVLSVGAAPLAPKELAVKRLLADAPGTRKKAQNELLAARSKLISDLSKIVDDKNIQIKRTDSVLKAMFILGEMRAVEAVDVLVANIAFPDNLPPDTTFRRNVTVGLSGTIRTRPFRTCRAVEALTKIGQPCIKAIINELATTDGMSERYACIRVLIELRKDDEVAAMLKHAIKQESAPKKIERLQKGLDTLSILDGPPKRRN